MAGRASAREDNSPPAFSLYLPRSRSATSSQPPRIVEDAGGVADPRANAQDDGLSSDVDEELFGECDQEDRGDRRAAEVEFDRVAGLALPGSHTSQPTASDSPSATSSISSTTPSSVSISTSTGVGTTTPRAGKQSASAHLASFLTSYYKANPLPASSSPLLFNATATMTQSRPSDTRSKVPSDLPSPQAASHSVKRRRVDRSPGAASTSSEASASRSKRSRLPCPPPGPGTYPHQPASSSSAALFRPARERPAELPPPKFAPPPPKSSASIEGSLSSRATSVAGWLGTAQSESPASSSGFGDTFRDDLLDEALERDMSEIFGPASAGGEDMPSARAKETSSLAADADSNADAAPGGATGSGSPTHCQLHPVADPSSVAQPSTIDLPQAQSISAELDMTMMDGDDANDNGEDAFALFSAVLGPFAPSASSAPSNQPLLQSSHASEDGSAAVPVPVPAPAPVSTSGPVAPLTMDPQLTAADESQAVSEAIKLATLLSSSPWPTEAKSADPTHSSSASLAPHSPQRRSSSPRPSSLTSRGSDGSPNSSHTRPPLPATFTRSYNRLRNQSQKISSAYDKLKGELVRLQIEESVLRNVVEVSWEVEGKIRKEADAPASSASDSNAAGWDVTMDFQRLLDSVPGAGLFDESSGGDDAGDGVPLLDFSSFVRDAGVEPDVDRRE